MFRPPARPRFPVSQRSRRQRAIFALLAALTASVGALAGLLPAITPAHAAGDFRPLSALPSLGGGRRWSVAVSPTEPATVLVGSDAGVYTSRDSGTTWHLTLPGVRAWVVGFDARNAATAFAGTGQRGVLSSPDGGTTWTDSSSGLATGADVRAMAFGLDGVAAGTGNGVYLSADGHSWHYSGLAGDSVAALAVATNAPQFTVIAGIDSGDLTPGFLYRGTGTTWQALQSGLPTGAAASSLTAGPIDATVTQRPLVAVTTKGVYRSGDSGSTWTSATGVPQTVSPTTACFDPLDPSVVYAGADQGGSTGGALLRSTDSGMTFALFQSGLPNNAVNVERIALVPTNPLGVVAAIDPPRGAATLYAASDGSLPAPPQLSPEVPGAPVATVVVPAPTPAPRPQPSHGSPQAAPATGFAAFAASAFHWPTPLVFEILFVVVLIYAVVRWREREYVEGPP